MNQDQWEKIKNGAGFIAALDQSGGSTPKTLAAYGISENEYHSEAEMFALVHQMRARLITSPAFGGAEILGAILFARTMDSDIDGLPTADYLWQQKQVVPFLKIDQGLADEVGGVAMMKPIDNLTAVLRHAQSKNIFGTKMRSVIKAANPAGIKQIVEQQFDFSAQILAHDLMPIIEPEVDININDKVAAEKILRDELLTKLDQLDDAQQVMLKLTIPTIDNFYLDLVNHPRVLRVVALSGGYSQTVADAKLAHNDGLIASFSRALLEGLTVQQSAAEFDQTLARSISAIYQASTVKD